MKRALTQKVDPIPACAADDCSMVESNKPIPPEVNRRARTSAAMIGLAISMGASSVLLPRQGEGAMAAEPVANSGVPTVTSSSATEEAVSQEVKSVTAAEVLSPKTLEHKIEESQNIRVGTSLSKEPLATAETLNQVQQAEKVEGGGTLVPVAPTNTATNGQFASGSIQAPSWANKISSPTSEINSQNTAPGTLYTVGVEADRSRQSAVEEASRFRPTGSSATAANNVNELLKAKQAVALDRLRESSNRLRNSLAEWKSEESFRVSAQEIEQKAPIVVSEHLKPIVDRSPASVRVSRWQPKVAAVEPAVAQQLEAKLANAPMVVPQPVVEQPTVGEATVSVVYQVKPGDTIDAIAQNYGISVATLAKANSLNNPNRIQIAQQLKIPQTGSIGSEQPSIGSSSYLSSASSISGKSNLDLSFQSSPVSPKQTVRNVSTASWKPNVPVVSALTPQQLADDSFVPQVASTNPTAIAAALPLSMLGTDDIPPGYMGGIYDGVEEEEKGLPTAGTKSLSSTKYPGASIKDEDLESSEYQVNETLVADNTSSGESPNRTKQNSNPYVERLRAEILQLRQQYQHYPGSKPSQSNPAVGKQPPTRYATPSAQEFKPNQYNQALQAEIQRRAEEVPDRIPATTARQLQQAATPAPAKRQVVATAPTSPEYYQPYSQPGQTVAPELPPIENQYQYPEGLNQQFNGYSWPTRGVLTSGYGRRWGRMHRGIDIAAGTGTPIFASAPGVVVYARWNSGGYGKLVQIMHPDGSMTRYGHNSRIYVQEGQVVEQGQQIAAMGSTGRSTGPHCHFEIHSPGRGAVNPMAFLPTN